MIWLKGLGPVQIPGVLVQHVLTDRVNESTEAFGLANSAVAPKDGDHPHKSLLPHVIHAFGRKVPGAQHDAQDTAKIGCEMLLGRRFSVPETIYIRLVEREKFQIVPSLLWVKYSFASAQEAMEPSSRNETNCLPLPLLVE